MPVLSLSWQLSYSNTYFLPVSFINIPKNTTSEYEEGWGQESGVSLGKESVSND